MKKSEANKTNEKTNEKVPEVFIANGESVVITNRKNVISFKIEHIQF